jgi:hypothetical protein
MLCGLALILLALPARAAVYQWSTTIDELISPESKSHPRAFLWIPDRCQRARAVVIASQNMQEEQLFQNPQFRKTLSELNFALIWIAPPMGTNDFRFDQGEDRVLDHLLTTLADRSGYLEIRTAPLVPVGHSATASWPWDIAAWNPDRVLAVISLSGQWPYFSSKYWGNRTVDTVPGLTTKGEFEIGGSLDTGWYAGLKGDLSTAHPHMAFTHVIEPGDDHFAASDGKIELISLYLRKAAQYRLPAQSNGDDPVKLNPIDPTKTGWLYDGWRLDSPPEAPAAPVAEYQGRRDHAYWAFDEEMAHAIEKFQAAQRGKANILLAYRQSTGFTLPTPDHLEVHLKFEPIDDGLTFKVTGGFWDTVPPTNDNKPAAWQQTLSEGQRPIQQGDAIDHPRDEDSRLRIVPICGPVAQLSPDTFAIRFNRIGFDNPKRCNQICFNLIYPGDQKFKRQVERSELRFPLKNTQGTPQSINFSPFTDVRVAHGLKPIQLNATSSAGTHVYYYVREGPAEVDDNGLLTFTPIPPRAKYPIPITVVAWQWGRSAPPLMQSATPVEQSLQITR